MSLDLSDSALVNSWKDLGDQKSATNWVLWLLDGKTLSVKATGTGGLPELRSQLEQSADQVLFGGIKVYGIDSRGSTESRRTKLIALTWIGGSVSVLKKAKVSVQRNEVQSITKGMACSLDTSDVNDLTSTNVAALLLKAGAAHKPTQYDFGGGETFDIQLNEYSN